jgi:urea carboxylase-associated protein 2
MAARDHARAQEGMKVRGMPTIPASAAQQLPPGVSGDAVVWDETLDAGEYAARVVVRGTRLRLTDEDGDACGNFLCYNADRPIERLNVADTVKVQWNAYIGQGSLLLSDMGRALASIVADTSSGHDVLCGCSNAGTNAAKYGNGENYSAAPNARDRFTLALAKFGLSRREIPPSINFFTPVRVGVDGSVKLSPRPGRAGAYVELRAEMNLLVVLLNTPHPLDDRSKYTATPLRLLAWRGPLTSADDPIRIASPEAKRAFLNVEDYFAR